MKNIEIFYVGVMYTRNVSEYVPGTDSERESVGVITSVDWNCENGVRRTYTLEEINKYLGKWMQYYRSAMPPSFRIIFEPVIDMEK